ncbi:hypothetical protein PMIN06_012886 [Paraphaeosphaeria minitans]
MGLICSVHVHGRQRSMLTMVHHHHHHHPTSQRPHSLTTQSMEQRTTLALGQAMRRRTWCHCRPIITPLCRLHVRWPRFGIVTHQHDLDRLPCVIDHRDRRLFCVDVHMSAVSAQNSLSAKCETVVVT